MSRIGRDPDSWGEHLVSRSWNDKDRQSLDHRNYTDGDGTIVVAVRESGYFRAIRAGRVRMRDERTPTPHFPTAPPCDIHHSQLLLHPRTVATFRNQASVCRRRHEAGRKCRPEHPCSTRPSAPRSTASTPTLFRWKSTAPASRPTRTTSTPSACPTPPCAKAATASAPR